MLRNKKSIENCWEQFSMLCEKKICKMHIKLNVINILAYLFSLVNNKQTKKERALSLKVNSSFDLKVEFSLGLKFK